MFDPGNRPISEGPGEHISGSCYLSQFIRVIRIIRDLSYDSLSGTAFLKT